METIKKEDYTFAADIEKQENIIKQIHCVAALAAAITMRKSKTNSRN